MGLDIYFSKVGSLDYSLNKKTAIDDQIVLMTKLKSVISER